MGATQRRMVVALLALSGMSCPAVALAWNAVGHRAIGAIAERLVAGTATAAQVRAVLGSESMATAAVWADCAKSVVEQPPYRYVSSDRFPECRPYDTPHGRQQMIDYVRRNHDACGPDPGEESCHRQYHYADIDTALGRYERGAPGSSDHDIVAGIHAAIEVLQGRAPSGPFSIRSRQEALRLLVHWVGDLHQPLHVAGVHVGEDGSRLEPANAAAPLDSGTRGGNLVQHDGRSLHAEWDDAPPDLDPNCCADAGAELARAVPPSPGSMGDWPALWASEAVQNSQRVFDGLRLAPKECRADGHCAWSATAPADYGQQRVALQRQAIVTAAARLAQLLQAIWPP